MIIRIRIIFFFLVITKMIVTTEINKTNSTTSALVTLWLFLIQVWILWFEYYWPILPFTPMHTRPNSCLAVTKSLLYIVTTKQYNTYECVQISTRPDRLYYRSNNDYVFYHACKNFLRLLFKDPSCAYTRPSIIKLYTSLFLHQ